MAFDSGNFLVIGGGNPYRPGDFFIHERENKDGKPGKVVTMADGNGDLREVVKGYIEKGFDPSKIIVNGQPASDLFESSTKKAPIEKENKQLSLVDRIKLAAMLMAGRVAGTSMQNAQQQLIQDNLRFQDLMNQQHLQNFMDFQNQQLVNQINLQNTLQMHHGM